MALIGVTRSQCLSLCTLSLSKLVANIRLCHMHHLLMVCALFVQAFSAYFQRVQKVCVPILFLSLNFELPSTRSFESIYSLFC